MPYENEYINGVRKDIYEGMCNIVKELFETDFTVIVGERRYMWDSEKKEITDIKEEKEMTSNDPDDYGCTGSYTLF